MSDLALPVDARADAQAADPLDLLIAPEVRRVIEQTYGARINAQASLAAALEDPRFLEAPGEHLALYSDHGIVHARDVARQVVQVLDIADGRLIPGRSPARLGWMKAYGVLLACLHDIGMVDASPVGRAMHPEFATQAVLGPGFDAVMRLLRSDDRGGIAARLDHLHRDGALGRQAPDAVLRELAAMANCHSKSKVPVAILNDRSALRRTMRAAAASELHALHRAQLRRQTPDPPSGDPDAFAWLELTDAPSRALVEDVVDTLRALRCADALRQRGTVLKTSGSYEVFVDERSANAVYALRPDAERLYLLEVTDPVAAGEANLSGSQLDAEGDLRIAFHHGAFRDPETILKAARSAALIVDDIQSDAIGSFERGGDPDGAGLRSHADIRILLESLDENPAFADLVRQELALRNPAAAARVRIVAALDPGSAAERSRYLRSSDIDWDLARRRDLLQRIARSGHRTGAIDPAVAFREVRRIDLRGGDTLIEAGTPSSFVYVPLGEGLRGLPLGGYAGFTIRPWVLVGVTGVIRGAARNARIVADRDVALLAIPKGVFLDHWHATYDQAAFAALFRAP